jgi:hypothetical protein
MRKRHYSDRMISKTVLAASRHPGVPAGLKPREVEQQRLETTRREVFRLLSDLVRAADLQLLRILAFEPQDVWMTTTRFRIRLFGSYRGGCVGSEEDQRRALTHRILDNADCRHQLESLVPEYPDLDLDLMNHIPDFRRTRPCP